MIYGLAAVPFPPDIVVNAFNAMAGLTPFFSSVISETKPPSIFTATILAFIDLYGVIVHHFVLILSEFK